MENKIDKKQFINNKGQSIDNQELCSINEDNITFVPTENIRAIEKVITNWEAVKILWKQTRPSSLHGEGFSSNLYNN